MTGPRRAAGASGWQQSSVNDHKNLGLGSLWNTPKKSYTSIWNMWPITAAFSPQSSSAAKSWNFFFSNFIWKKYVSSFNSQQRRPASCEHMSSPTSSTKRNLKSGKKKCQSDAIKVRPRVRVRVYHVRPLQQRHVTRSCLVVGRHSMSEEEPVNSCGVWAGARFQVIKSSIRSWLPTSHGFSTKG